MLVGEDCLTVCALKDALVRRFGNGRWVEGKSVVADEQVQFSLLCLSQVVFDLRPGAPRLAGGERSRVRLAAKVSADHMDDSLTGLDLSREHLTDRAVL